MRDEWRNFCTEVVNEKRLAMSADGLVHAMEMVKLKIIDLPSRKIKVSI